MNDGAQGTAEEASFHEGKRARETAWPQGWPGQAQAVAMADVKRTQNGRYVVVHGQTGKRLAGPFRGEGAKRRAQRKARHIKQRNS